MSKASIILPTFNESGNIVGLIRDIKRSIPSGWQQEIVVVDDNSPDGTYELARKTFEGDPAVRVLLRVQDRGLAKSIRTGLEAATGDYLVVMDTDFSHDPAEIPRLLHVNQICDLVAGSRFCAGGGMEDRRRYLASLVYNWYVRVILGTQIQDNLSGYFSIQRSRLAELPFDLVFIGYGDYFFRLLHFAQKRQMTLVEIPVRYRTRTAGRSKSNFMRMLLTYTVALVRLKRAAAREAKC